MTENDFYKLVERTRNLQKEYFKKRGKGEPCQDVLTASKAAEKQIDEAIKEYNGKDSLKQKSLF